MRGKTKKERKKKRKKQKKGGKEQRKDGKNKGRTGKGKGQGRTGKQEGRMEGKEGTSTWFVDRPEARYCLYTLQELRLAVAVIHKHTHMKLALTR